MFYEKPIGEIADVTKLAGFEFTKYIKYNETGEIIALRALNLRNGELDLSDVKRIDRSVSEGLIRSKLYVNDILLTYTGNGYGDCAIIEENNKYHLAPNICKIVPNLDLVEPYFLYSYIRSKDFYKQMSSNMTGSGQPTIPMKTIRTLKVPVPQMEIQRKIANILQTINLKLRTNRSINKNLQAQAQAVFLHLFADNESVIPASIADVALNVTDGVHNTVHDDPDGEYLLLSCKNIKGGSLSIGTSERRINAETFEKLRRRTKLAKGDVLISSVGTVGELLLVNTEPSNYEFQRSVAMVKPNPDIVSSVYLYEALLSQKAELINAAHGAVQQCLFISDIAGFPIGIPTQDDLLTFDEVATPMFNTITTNEAESIRLAALRDALLPNLMSGEIDVSGLDL